MKPIKWESELAWLKIHIDYAGTHENNIFCGDGWFLYKMVKVLPKPPRPDKELTIRVLWIIFHTFGLPIELVSDNATSFTNHDFREFLKSNVIKHTLIPLPIF